MYQALYRKYRPQTFSDVVGQEHVTETLRNAVKSGRLSHAYLFTGSRGTGKTSCAKILAKAVNCENPVDGNPCGKCAACRGIDDGSILDVIEIDAASNNGVDNIRDLREEANYTPSAVKYRVYIIDEVHMLSVGAFNALLKTLEEPPEHVKFILATTEVHKLPSTILSRCQRFDFKRISPEDIAKRLLFVADKENIDLTPEAAMLISRIADGALRDALSLLDRCASYGTEITEKVASDAAGIAGREHLFELVDAVISHDSPRALTIIDELYNNSCDMERFLSELLSHFRNMMVALTVPNFRELVICPDSEIEIIRRQAKSLTLESVLSCMDRIGDAIVEIKRGADRRTSAEMAVIRLTSPKLDTDTAAVLRRISDIEVKLKNGVFKPSPESRESAFAANASPVKQSEPNEAQTQQVKNEKPESKEAVSDKTPAAYAEPNNAEPKVNETSQDKNREIKSDEVFENWAEVVDILSRTSPALTGFLNGSTAFVHPGGFLLIKSSNSILGQMLMTGNFSNDIVKAVYEVSGKKYRIGIYNDEHTEAKPKKDPLDGLLSRAKELGINVIDQ